LATRFIVKPASRLNPILRGDQFVLELEKTAVRLQIRVAFRQRKEPIDLLHQGRFIPALFFDAVVFFIGLVPCLDDGVERGPFVSGITFDRLDQIRNQIVPSLQLGIDVGPRFPAVIPQPHQSIERADQPQEREEKKGAQNEQDRDEFHREVAGVAQPDLAKSGIAFNSVSPISTAFENSQGSKRDEDRMARRSLAEK